MPKSLVRIVALLLIPPLLADPVFARAYSDIGPLSKQLQVIPLFATQAIPARALSTLSDIFGRKKVSPTEGQLLKENLPLTVEPTDPRQLQEAIATIRRFRAIEIKYWNLRRDGLRLELQSLRVPARQHEYDDFLASIDQSLDEIGARREELAKDVPAAEKILFSQHAAKNDDALEWYSKRLLEAADLAELFKEPIDRLKIAQLGEVWTPSAIKDLRTAADLAERISQLLHLANLSFNEAFPFPSKSVGAAARNGDEFEDKIGEDGYSASVAQAIVLQEPASGSSIQVDSNGKLSSFQVGGKEILYNRGNAWDGVTPLGPWVGRLHAGRFISPEGHEVNVQDSPSVEMLDGHAIHGMVMRMPHRVIDLDANSPQPSVRLELENRTQMGEYFGALDPSILYRLENGKLVLEQRISNTSESPRLLSFGQHIVFDTPEDEEWTLTVPGSRHVRALVPADETSEPVEGTRYDFRKGVLLSNTQYDFGLTGVPHGPVVAVLRNKMGREIRVSWDGAAYPHVWIWAEHGHTAVEPMTSLPNLQKAALITSEKPFLGRITIEQKLEFRPSAAAPAAPELKFIRASPQAAKGPALFLIRHGETGWLAKSQALEDITTRSDLSPRGEKQIDALGKQLKDHGVTVDVIFYSPLRRARHSAEILRPYISHSGTEFIEAPDVRERAYGYREYLHHEEVSQQTGQSIDEINAQLNDMDHAWEGAESNRQVIQRVTAYTDQTIMPALRQGKRVAVIGHGGSLRAIVKNIEHLTDAQYFEAKIKPAEVITYKVTNPSVAPKNLREKREMFGAKEGRPDKANDASTPRTENGVSALDVSLHKAVQLTGTEREKFIGALVEGPWKTWGQPQHDAFERFLSQYVLEQPLEGPLKHLEKVESVWFEEGQEALHQMPTFKLISDVPERMSRLLEAITLLRVLMHRKYTLPVAEERKMQPTPLDLASQEPLYSIRLGELHVLPFSHSFRRWVITDKSGLSRLVLKLPGEDDGREWINPAHYDAAADLWTHYPKDPGVLRPVFLLRYHGAVPLYATHRQFQEDSLNIAGLEYQDGWRWDEMTWQTHVRLAQKLGKTPEQLTQDFLTDVLVTSIRLHRLGWSGTKGHRSDMRKNNVLILPNGRAILVGDFGAFGKRPLSTEQRLAETFALAGLVPTAPKTTEILQGVAPAVVSRILEGVTSAEERSRVTQDVLGELGLKNASVNPSAASPSAAGREAPELKKQEPGAAAPADYRMEIEKVVNHLELSEAPKAISIGGSVENGAWEFALISRNAYLTVFNTAAEVLASWSRWQKQNSSATGRLQLQGGFPEGGPDNTGIAHASVDVLMLMGVLSDYGIGDNDWETDEPLVKFAAKQKAALLDNALSKVRPGGYVIVGWFPLVHGDRDRVDRVFDKSDALTRYHLKLVAEGTEKSSIEDVNRHAWTIYRVGNPTVSGGAHSQRRSEPVGATPVSNIQPLTVREAIQFLKNKEVFFNLTSAYAFTDEDQFEEALNAISTRSMRASQRSLHVGTGHSILPVIEALMGLDVTAIDKNPHSIANMKRHMQQTGILAEIARRGGRLNFKVADALDGDNSSDWVGPFDHITALDFYGPSHRTIHYEQVLKKISQAISSEGTLLISLPEPHPRWTLKKAQEMGQARGLTFFREPVQIATLEAVYLFKVRPSNSAAPASAGTAPELKKQNPGAAPADAIRSLATRDIQAGTSYERKRQFGLPPLVTPESAVQRWVAQARHDVQDFLHRGVRVRRTEATNPEGRVGGPDRILEQVKYTLDSQPDPDTGGNILHVTYTREDGQTFDSGRYAQSHSGDITETITGADGSIEQRRIPREKPLFNAIRLAFDMGGGYRRARNSPGVIVVQYTEDAVQVALEQIGDFRISRDKPALVTSGSRLAPSDVATAAMILVQMALVLDPSIKNNLDTFSQLQSRHTLDLLPSEFRKMFGVKSSAAAPKSDENPKTGLALLGFVSLGISGISPWLSLGLAVGSLLLGISWMRPHLSKRQFAAAA